jgi:phosphoribosylglycinamide formyltransferase-1
MKKIAIFASGSGTNAQNIIAFFEKDNSAEVVLVLSNNPKAIVLERAKKHQVQTCVFDSAQLESETGVLNTLLSHEIEFIVLAGFLWKFPKALLAHFGGRVINIHPALLPKYGGKGMYGEHVHRAVIKNKEKSSGITIHYVNEHYDDGAVIFQAECPVSPGDTAEDLAKKVHALEQQYFPKIIKKLIVTNG